MTPTHHHSNNHRHHSNNHRHHSNSHRHHRPVYIQEQSPLLPPPTTFLSTAPTPIGPRLNTLLLSPFPSLHRPTLLYIRALTTLSCACALLLLWFHGSEHQSMTISRIAAVIAVVQVFLHEVGFLIQTYYATRPENPYRDNRLPRFALLGYLVTIGATILSANHACQWGKSTGDGLILEKALAISAAVMLLEVVMLNRIVGENVTWLIGLGLVVLVVVVEAFWRFQTVERAWRHWRELDWVAVPGWIGLWAVHRIKGAMMGEASE